VWPLSRTVAVIVIEEILPDRGATRSVAMPTNDQLLKRVRKKARKGMRGWPVATIAFYGPNLSRATKVAVGIIPSEDAEPTEMRDWQVETGDVRKRYDHRRGNP
jgi:hypothetical protein